MGDVAMTVPVLLKVAAEHPDVKLTMISRQLYKPIFDSIPNLNFLAFDAKGKHKGFFGLLRFTAVLRKSNIDAFADLHNVLRSKVIGQLLKLYGIKVAVFDKARAQKKALTRAENKTFEPLPSVFKRHAMVFAELGVPIDLSQPRFLKPLVPDDQIRPLAGVEKQLIGIAPFAQHEGKIYPFDLMQQVVDNLANEYILLLFGSKAEAETLHQLARSRSNIEVVAGKYSFEQELELISNLEVMLSMDSANAHIAAMFGVKVITLWGATHPYTGFMPYNQPLENAIVSDRKKYPKLPTSIYGNKKVAGYQDAMRTISPEMVVAKVKEVIA